MEKRTAQYLIEEKGYKQEDLLKVDAQITKGAPHTTVIFKDEPEVIYYYRDKKGEITQSGVRFKIKIYI
jgi:hypothetical protein